MMDFVRNRAVWILATAALLLNGRSSAQEVLFRLHDNRDVGQFGTAVSRAGDVNADGYPDFIVGDPYDDTVGYNFGSASVFSGRDGSVIYTFYGEDRNGRYGQAVDGAGDVNADGFDDLIVGAFFDSTVHSYAGRVWVYSGADGSVLHVFDPERDGDELGRAVSAAGDVDGDGFADVIIGAPGGGDPPLGQARIFSGYDGTLLRVLEEPAHNASRFGADVAGLGDLDGDGFAEVIVGSPFSNEIREGYARVYSGADASVVFMFRGDSYTGSGARVVCAGDVDADQVPDIAVADWNFGFPEAVPHSVRVFSGADGSVLHTLYADPVDPFFGFAVDGAGDVNGDGLADLIVGDPGRHPFPSDSGRVQVFSGADGSILCSLDGAEADSHFGWDVSGLGDVDGNGFDDFLVGIPHAHDGPYEAGRRVVSGSATVYGSKPPFLSAWIPPAGSHVVLRATQLPPNTATYLFASLEGPGKTLVPALELTLNLKDAIQARGPTATNGAGTVEWRPHIPIRELYRHVWFQAAQSGSKTNVTAASLLP